MEKLNKYPNYKPSGIEWIGDIPEYWEVKRIKVVLENEQNGIWGDEPKGNEYDKICIRVADFDKEFDKLENKNFTIRNIVKQDYERRKLEFGDLLIEKSGGGEINPVGRVAYFDLKGIEAVCANFLARLRIKNSHNSRFFFYLFKVFYKNRLNVRSIKQTTGIQNLDTNSYFQEIAPIPPLAEQISIANFLDDKTAKIDSLIEKKKKLIELYKEERTGVINQAVTRGINPNVKLKPSGIDWLGDIPEHWEVKKLRYIGNCQNGVSKGSEYFGSGFPFISYGDVYNNEEIPSNLNGLAQSSEQDRVVYSVCEGDIFFTRTSETIEEIGIASICMKTINDATFSGFLIRVRPQEGVLHNGFSKYFFRCQKHRNFFVKEMNIVTRASLSQDLLKSLPVLIPPFNEQIQIFEFLDAETKRIDEKIKRTEKEIELLQEYRTALISEVVTGKIKVIDN